MHQDGAIQPAQMKREMQRRHQNSLADLAHELVSVSLMRCAFGPKISALQRHFCLLYLAELSSTDGQQIPEDVEKRPSVAQTLWDKINWNGPVLWR